MASENDVQKARTFVKEVGGETRTRTVYTAADEVDAKYEGYTEQKSPKSSSSSTSSSRASGSSPS